MFAINHAATALVIRRRFPDVPFVLILLSVQAIEFAWVALNMAGIERTTTEAVVRDVGDIHLVYMPFSHSVATATALALVVFITARVLGARRAGSALAIGIMSHLVLDLLTHNGDIPLAPFVDAGSYGTYLYGNAPAVAFVCELLFGLACCWMYGGGAPLYAVVTLFNLANVSMFFASIPGPEALMAGRPSLLVWTVFGQMVITLAAVAWGANRGIGAGVHTRSAAGDGDRHVSTTRRTILRL